MMVPTIHLNGTSREHLSGQARRAAQAVIDAIDAICDAAPNGRDYYVQGDAAFEAARREHLARIERLESVKAELVALWEAIEEQAS